MKILMKNLSVMLLLTVISGGAWAYFPPIPNITVRLNNNTAESLAWSSNYLYWNNEPNPLTAHGSILLSDASLHGGVDLSIAGCNNIPVDNGYTGTIHGDGVVCIVSYDNGRNTVIDVNKA